MKPGARLVNTARGGIVDEDALAKALEDGPPGRRRARRVRGRADHGQPAVRLDNVVVTPHLGASTREAQDKAGTTVAEMVRLALRGEFVPYAVNVSAGAEVSEIVRPFVPLAERLGALLAGLAEGGVRSIVCSYIGRIAEADTRVLTLAILKGILGKVVSRAGLVRERADARARARHHRERDALDGVGGLREPHLASRRHGRRSRVRGRHARGQARTPSA